jgi:hypothetical protein
LRRTRHALFIANARASAKGNVGGLGARKA